MRSQQIKEQVSNKLQEFNMEFGIKNVAYIWLIKDFDKKSLPNGRHTGIIYDVENELNNTVLVYTCDKGEVSWGESQGVVGRWINPNHLPFTSPRARYKRSAPKKTNKITFEDAFDRFVELYDDPNVSIQQGAIALDISYSKFWKWSTEHTNNLTKQVA